MSVHPLGRTALYRFFDSDGNLLYVGVTNNPLVRSGAHSYDKPWWPEVASHTHEWLETRADALAAEETAIRTELPRYNKTGMPNYPPKPPADGQSISTAEFRAKLSDVANRARYTGHVSYLCNRGTRVAAVVPVEVAERYEAERAKTSD